MKIPEIMLLKRNDIEIKFLSEYLKSINNYN